MAQKKGKESKSLKQTLAELQKKFGDNCIVNNVKSESVPSISSGSIVLDSTIGEGIPKGRITELFGPKAAGKTSLATNMMISVQKKGGKVAYVDVEHAFSVKFAENMGLKLDDTFYYVKLEKGEQFLDVVDSLARTGEIDLIVVDSIAALSAGSEADSSIEANHVGLNPRMVNQAVRVITPQISKTGTALLVINQIRMKVGVMFGNPETTPGGYGIHYGSSLRMRISRISEKKKEGGGEEDEETVQKGHKSRISIVHSKVGYPGGKCEVSFGADGKIDKSQEILTVAVKYGIVEKNGAFFKYDGNNIGQGAEKASKYLQDNPKVAEEIMKKVKV